MYVITKTGQHPAFLQPASLALHHTQWTATDKAGRRRQMAIMPKQHASCWYARGTTTIYPAPRITETRAHAPYKGQVKTMIQGTGKMRSIPAINLDEGSRYPFKALIKDARSGRPFVSSDVTNAQGRNALSVQAFPYTSQVT